MDKINFKYKQTKINTEAENNLYNDFAANLSKSNNIIIITTFIINLIIFSVVNSKRRLHDFDSTLLMIKVVITFYFLIIFLQYKYNKAYIFIFGVLNKVLLDLPFIIIINIAGVLALNPYFIILIQVVDIFIRMILSYFCYYNSRICLAYSLTTILITCISINSFKYFGDGNYIHFSINYLIIKIVVLNSFTYAIQKLIKQDYYNKYIIEQKNNKFQNFIDSFNSGYYSYNNMKSTKKANYNKIIDELASNILYKDRNENYVTFTIGIIINNK